MPTAPPFRAAALLVVLAISQSLQPQEACFRAVAAPPWVGMDVGSVGGGASRPLAAAGGYELCSQSFGLGDRQDSLRYLFRGARADFEMVARVERIEAVGLGGVMAAVGGRTASEPYVAITVRRLPTGALELESSFRAEEGGTASTGGAKPVAADLPILLKLRREGSTCFTSYSHDGQRFQDHLRVDGAGTSLTEFFMTVGMIQASNSRQGAASAIFLDPRVSSRDVSTPPSVLGVDPPSSPLEGGLQVTITGARLEKAREVSLAGVPARILRVGDGSLVVEAGPSKQAVRGGVIVTTDEGSDVLEDAFVYIGHQFIRGDFNGDGTPDLSDAVAGLNFLFLGARGPQCTEVADINSDGKHDLSDEVYLLGHLFLGLPSPRAPYPRPGLGDRPGEPCGLPSAPLVERIEPTTIQEGSLVTLYGSGFDIEQKERNAVLFGGSLAEVVDATPEKLVVRAKRLPQAETVNVAILHDIDDFVTVLPHACRLDGCGLSIGGIIAVIDHIPIQVEQRPGPVYGTSRIERDGSLVLEIDRRGWDPRQTYGVRGSLLVPFLTGISRGGRYFELEFSHLHPKVTFGEWVGVLASRLQDRLGSGEFDVEQDGDGGRIRLRSNKSLAPFLTANAAWSASALDIFTVFQNGKCGPGEIDPIADPRDFGWCRFEELVESCGGLPRWEYFIPKGRVFQLSSGIFPLPFPWDLSTSEKRVLYNLDAYCHVRKTKLYKTCTLDEMVADGLPEIPNFPKPAIVIKTGWTTQASILARGGDPSKYYTYTDASNNVRYLELFHFTTKDIDKWFWATFWVPTPDDPGPPGFNCGTGGNADIPGTIPAPWSNYNMCVNIAEDAPCGNPNFASAECPTAVGDRGCMSCHKDASYGGTKLDFLFSVSDGPQGTCP